jgi:hypothetical protein
MPKAKKEKAAKPKTGRQPSAYNLFMKAEIQRVKAENPSLSHKEAFSKAVQNVL